MPVGGKYVLLRNERNEWELPGGKLEPGEDPIPCVVREIREELSLDVTAGDLLDCWRYQITPTVEVLIVTYGTIYRGSDLPKISHEHKELRLFGVDDLPGLNMPIEYMDSIRRWHAMLTR